MEIKGIGGGQEFSIVKFKDKLGFATKHDSSKIKRDNILKVVRSSESAIRSGRFNTASAMSKMKSLGSNLSYDEVNDIKKVFQQLGTVSKSAPVKESSVQKAVASAEAKRAAKIKDLNKTKPGEEHHNLARINRDSSSYFGEQAGAGKDQERTGLSSGSVSTGNHYSSSINRGQTTDKGLDTRDVNKSTGHQRLNL